MEITVTVKNTEEVQFAKALELIALDKSDKNDIFKCVGYKVVDNVMYLFRHNYEDCTILPYEFNLVQTITFAWGWYKTNKPTSQAPDTDGDVEIAFEITTQLPHGLFGYDWAVICSVKPIWFIYGK